LAALTFLSISCYTLIQFSYPNLSPFFNFLPFLLAISFHFSALLSGLYSLLLLYHLLGVYPLLPPVKLYPVLREKHEDLHSKALSD
jgi:hypothetical protein